MTRSQLIAYVTAVTCTAGAAALAPGGRSFDLSWHTIDGGGGMFSTADGLSLGGTIGQPDTGVMTGGGFAITAGFWPAAGGAAPCPWDCADGNGVVDTVDFLQLLAEWGSGASPCDFDGNDIVDTVDFLQLLANWGECP
jgi:hypothetical protein